MYTRNFNQDCVEHFFGTVRKQAGNDKKLTASSFKQAFKKLFTIAYMDKDSTGMNTVDTLHSFLSNYSRMSQLIASEANQDRFEYNEQEVTSEPPEDRQLLVNNIDYHDFDLVTVNSMWYVAGYILRKVLQKHSCDICLEYAQSGPRDNDHQFYTCQRSYVELTDITRRLLFPPEEFVSYISKLEFLLEGNFEKACLGDVGYQLLQRLKVVELDHPCVFFPKDFLLKFYIRLRIFFICKFANDKIQTVTKHHEKKLYFKRMIEELEVEADFGEMDLELQALEDDRSDLEEAVDERLIAHVQF